MAFFDRIIRPHFDRAFFERVEASIEGVFASTDYYVALDDDGAEIEETRTGDLI